MRGVGGHRGCRDGTGICFKHASAKNELTKSNLSRKSEYEGVSINFMTYLYYYLVGIMPNTHVLTFQTYL
jgi:hypothetical protein